MSIAFKVIKKVAVLLFSLLIASVTIFALWRVFSSGDPKSMKTLNANEALVSAYERDGDGLYMFRQEQRSITSGESNYGYFSITNFVFIPEANQVQAVVRYNNGTLKNTARDFSLDEIPSRDEDIYDVTLLLAIDLTPDTDEDNFGNDPESVRLVRCHGSTVLSDTKTLYNYRRLVFELDDAELDLEELLDEGLLLAVYADFYYVGALDYDAVPYGTLCLYDFKSKDVRVKLEKKDIKALKEYSAAAD